MDFSCLRLCLNNLCLLIYLNDHVLLLVCLSYVVLIFVSVVDYVSRFDNLSLILSEEVHVCS